MADNKENKVLKSSIEREQSQTCLNSAEREKIKGSKNLNVPHLRFPEFRGEWESSRLSSFAKKITKKNKGNIISNVLCNSANFGIIPQSEYFDRGIANTENTDTYYIIENGDFVYNPRKSVTAPYGPVNMYNGKNLGIISPLYLCFTVKDISKDFLLNWFKGNKWHRYVYSHGDTGVRYDRVSIKDDIFLDMPINIPVIAEQEKISKTLNLLDERIATQNKVIEKYKSLIKGIIYQTKSIGLAHNTWQKTELRKVLQERNEKNVNGYDVCSVSVTQGVVNQIEYLGRSFAAKDTQHYNVVKYGDIVYTKSPTGDFPYGIVKRSNIKSNVAVSPLYGVYKPVNDYIGIILHFYFLEPNNALNYLHPLVQKGAKNTINITNGRFLENSILLPKKEDETKRLAWILTTIQSKIILEQNLLQSYLKQKQYLLRQMFI